MTVFTGRKRILYNSVRHLFEVLIPLVASEIKTLSLYNMKKNILIVLILSRNSVLGIQYGPKVLRQTATTHGGGSGESFEVGSPCSETHRYAPVSAFLERMNARLAMSHSPGQRARSGMRFSFVSFHSNRVCLSSSVVPCRL